MSPPLLIVPVHPLRSEKDVKDFDQHGVYVKDAQDGQVITFPCPAVLFHRIDGVWISLSDLGSFQTPPPSEPSQPIDAPRDDD